MLTMTAIIIPFGYLVHIKDWLLYKNGMKNDEILFILIIFDQCEKYHFLKLK